MQTHEQAKLTVDFFRHGIAQEPDPDRSDAERSLTPEGRKKTQAVAQGLKRLGWQWDYLLTSPLTRAYQTALILQTEGLVIQEVIYFPALAPGGSFRDLTLWSQEHPDTHSICLVGHQPDLSQWISQSLWENILEPKEPIQLKKAGLARVIFNQGTLDPGQGVLSMLLTPKFIRYVLRSK